MARGINPRMDMDCDYLRHAGLVVDGVGEVVLRGFGDIDEVMEW